MGTSLMLRTLKLLICQESKNQVDRFQMFGEKDRFQRFQVKHITINDPVPFQLLLAFQSMTFELGQVTMLLFLCKLLVLRTMDS